ncbi:MAG: M28 family peptidase [Gammaproteobacteria bacterium]|nr:M28 family peptidase [Gammaproteobacteria bacterium]
MVACLIIAIIGFVTQPFVASISSQPPEVNPTRLEAHVKHLSAELYPRSFDQLRNIERAGQYIRDEFISAGADVAIQEVSVQESTYKNIIGRFGPTSGPLLVIGAHYDSHGDASEGAKYPLGFDFDTHTPGADDNASGVAGLIELAHLLHQKLPSRSVELVAYTLEEPPHFRTEHMGSVWHARSLVEANRNIQLMLSLEMIGFFSDDADTQSFPVPGMGFLYPERGNFIALVGRLDGFRAVRKAKALMSGATDLPVFSINAPSFIPGVDFSDHRSYWNLGFPALMVTDTAFYRNENYHRAGDTFEKLDYRRMAKVVQSIFEIAQQY